MRNDFRLFRLSRMTNLRIKEESFTPRDYQKPQLEFTEILETMQIEIKLRIHKSIMDRVLECCDYDHFVADGDAYCIVDFPFVENDYHYDILLGFGDKCECLKPQRIREKMKRKIHNIAILYDC